MTVQPDRLAALDTITLHEGGHSDFNDGHCAMEVVSWLADEGFTDAPACASPVLRRYTITLNDRWDDDRRQTLKPYLPRMVGTGGDGLDPARERIAADFVATRLLGPWLRLAGLDDHADQLAAVDTSDVDAVRRVLSAARSAAWAARSASRKRLEEKVRERLADRPAAAVAAAVAVADAAAVAAADAAAAAVAAAAAAAVAVAAAAAVAVADAAAAAVAAADAAADADHPWTGYSAAYRAARKYFDEHPLPIAQQVADLSAEQQPLALELLDAMIRPAAVSS